jgi:hypothetical protein
MMTPSSRIIGAFSHLSMYSSAHLHVTCLRTARSKSSWSMLSNRPFGDGFAGSQLRMRPRGEHGRSQENQEKQCKKRSRAVTGAGES